MANSSLLAEYVAALDAADSIAQDLIVIEVDAIEQGSSADLEKMSDEWDTTLARYWTGNDAEDRFRSRLLVDALVKYGARALHRVKRFEAAA